VIVNKKFWDGLPADVRGQLQQAMSEATKYEKAIAQQDNDMALDAIRKAGKTTIYTPTPQEQAEWRKVLVPVQKQMAGRVGQDLINTINKATASVQ
jgi:C4-dicarboxylate-binding protein DctP